MKKYVKTAIVLIICLSVFLVCFAGINVTASTTQRIVDEADLLTSGEESKLSAKLDEISDRIKTDIAIVTVDSVGAESVYGYAHRYSIDNGYGYGEGDDCVLLLVSMQNRDYQIYRRGFADTAFNAVALDYAQDSVEKYLGEDEFYEGFVAFADVVENVITCTRNGDVFDEDDIPKEPFPFFRYIVIALVIGLIISLIIVFMMKSQLKSVHSKYTANGYEKSGSMKVTRSHDFFLYRTITRVPRPQNTNSRGGSGSGRSNGGGKF